MRRLPTDAQTARGRAGVHTLHVGALDHARVQVGPVESMVHVVDGQSVGPAHFVHQGGDGAAVHVGSGYPGPTAPLRPEHVAVETQHGFSPETNWTFKE